MDSKSQDDYVRRMNDIGASAAEARQKLGELEVDAEVERSSDQMTVQGDLSQSFLASRRRILTAAVRFFDSSEEYFSRVPRWSVPPGPDPTSVDGTSEEQLEALIEAHERGWNEVEEVYAQAVSDGSELARLLREAGVEEREKKEKEERERLGRTQKELHKRWRERQVHLSSLHALAHFPSDIKGVVEWFDEYGEPYLRNHSGIGDSLHSSTLLRNKHIKFGSIANNIFEKEHKLSSTSLELIQSGVVESSQMDVLMSPLKERLSLYRKRLEARADLLNLSVVFHSHHSELLNWYASMREKFEKGFDFGKDKDSSGREMEIWLSERDMTKEAYAKTIQEGLHLTHAIHEREILLEVDYTAAAAHVNQLMDNIKQNNDNLAERGKQHQVKLHIVIMYAHFVDDRKRVLDEMRSWKVDMQDMVKCPQFVSNVEKLQSGHRGNTEKVKWAIKSIKRAAGELLRTIEGDELDGRRTNRGEREDVVEKIREDVREVEEEEDAVLRVSLETETLIERVVQVRLLSNRMCKKCEMEVERMRRMGGIPRDKGEAERALAEHEKFRQSIDNLTSSPATLHISDLMKELIREGIVDRNAIVELNEKVAGYWRWLFEQSNERFKLLKAAVAYYKTYYDGILPILEQLEKEYRVSPSVDFCRSSASESPQERTNHMSQLLRRHAECKDRFLKGCFYSQKVSELFLKYIGRAYVIEKEKVYHHNRVLALKASLRERQSVILELWTRKKKHLDRCHQFVLLEASTEQISEWLKGEGRERLEGFESYLKKMKKKKEEGEMREEFAKFMVLVKEKRVKVQTLLRVASSLQEEAVEHAKDIERCAEEVKTQYGLFSRKVSECEWAVGGRRAVRDELSLDRRHSDCSAEEKQKESEQLERMREPMRELIQTERAYVEDLRRCVDVYVREFDTAAPFSLREKRIEIFGNVEKIYDFHANKFVHELSKYEDDPEAVGCSFIGWVHLMRELYTEYCVNMKENNHVRALPETAQFFESIREKHHLQMNSEDLSALLIKPVQRITRYQLLMSKLADSCSGNLDEMREALEVVESIPRRANDVIHLNALDMNKDKLEALGLFVMQDSLTVWEPKSYFKKGKERQVFLFESAIVLAKRAEESSSKTLRYVAKGKPIQLASVSVVEHIEGDVCRFGLRLGGSSTTASSNENRVELDAESEKSKMNWVRRIRELCQGLLPFDLGVGLGFGSIAAGGSSTAHSTSSADRLSREVEFLSIGSNRLSLQSDDSQESDPRAATAMSSASTTVRE